MWRRRQRQIDELHARIDREIEETNKHLRQHERLLVQIASNTGSNLDD